MYAIRSYYVNYRMNELSAAIGLVQMERLDGFLAAREANFTRLARNNFV